MLPQCLSFLKESKISPGFRENNGPDIVFDLMDADALQEVPEVSGVYIIVATNGTKFPYPKGNSPVMYIGMSKNLHQRLTHHYRGTKNVAAEIEDYKRMNCQCNPRYHYFREFGAKVYVFTRRGLQDPKCQESIYIGKFYEKYFALPVGNGARSFYSK
ncbi:MAG: hypothetical protein SPE09_07045 [Alloprevotella sp.]|nr:hypothetical protein [Alloprevotella sp.]